jgi:hypothetical protein
MPELPDGEAARRLIGRRLVGSALIDGPKPLAHRSASERGVASPALLHRDQVGEVGPDLQPDRRLQRRRAAVPELDVFSEAEASVRGRSTKVAANASGWWVANSSSG